MTYNPKRTTGKIVSLLIGLVLLLCTSANSAGPKKVARTDRSLWPYPIHSPEAFDFASRMEMYVFIEVFLENAGIEKRFCKKINKWRADIRGHGQYR